MMGRACENSLLIPSHDLGKQSHQLGVGGQEDGEGLRKEEMVQYNLVVKSGTTQRVLCRPGLFSFSRKFFVICL